MMKSCYELRTWKPFDHLGVCIDRVHLKSFRKKARQQLEHSCPPGTDKALIASVYGLILKRIFAVGKFTPLGVGS